MQCYLQGPKKFRFKRAGELAAATAAIEELSNVE